METRIMMIIVLPEESTHAVTRITVSKWNGNMLSYNSRVYEGEARIKPIQADDNLYPWTVAAVRDVADEAISVMLDKMADHEVLLMHEVNLHQET